MKQSFTTYLEPAAWGSSACQPYAVSDFAWSPDGGLACVSEGEKDTGDRGLVSLDNLRSGGCLQLGPPYRLLGGHD